MIRHAWRLMRALDDHWIGDVIGGLALVMIFVVGLFGIAAFQ